MFIDLQNNYFTLSFPYNPQHVSIVKSLPDRRWDSKNKVWRVPASMDNLNYIEEHFKTINKSPRILSWVNDVKSIQRQILHAQNFKGQVELPVDYTFRTQPFEHQIKCFNFFKNLNMGGLFLEMGLGKTKIIIDILSYHRLMGNIKGKVLYVCPNSVMENAKREFEQHSPVNFKICILQGVKQKRQAEIHRNYDIYIINYEAVRIIYDDILHDNFECIICDESTRIKNSHAQCSKALHKLTKHVKYRYILTGTPITQSAIDIFSQYKFVEPTIFGNSFYAFRNKYAIMGGYLGKQIIGYRLLDELHDKLFQTAIRFTKKECLDLPDKVYEVKRFDLNADEKKLYKQIKDNLFIEIMHEKITSQLIITKLIKLSEITSGFIKTDSEKRIAINNCSKLQLLKETLEDILPNKIIIWCSFTANIVMISKLLEQMNINFVSMDGQNTIEERQDAVDKFQHDKNCSVFIGQIKTGGLGINLTAASYVIYYSNTYSLADRLQSEDRCHRIGQTKSVTYIDLVARKTIEESMIKILKGKLNLATMIIDKEQVEKIVEGVI